MPSDATRRSIHESGVKRPRRRCTFYDMKHSNNAARVRLWLRLNADALSTLETGGDLTIESVMMSHADIEADSYGEINPLKKVPALLTELSEEDGAAPARLQLFEAAVIMGFLEDVCPSPLVRGTPEERALAFLIVRCHDLYVSSPNCTQPNFSHTQGCMYLDPSPTPFTPERRTMDARTRHAKLTELHRQLHWLEGVAACAPYLGGGRLTHADLTWFPTAVFMELLLPRVFGWEAVFCASGEKERGQPPLPKLGAWFRMLAGQASFAKTRQEIRGTLLEQAGRGRFVGVREDVRAHASEYRWKLV